MISSIPVLSGPRRRGRPVGSALRMTPVGPTGHHARTSAHESSYAAQVHAPPSPLWAMTAYQPHHAGSGTSSRGGRRVEDNPRPHSHSKGWLRPVELRLVAGNVAKPKDKPGRPLRLSAPREAIQRDVASCVPSCCPSYQQRGVQRRQAQGAANCACQAPFYSLRSSRGFSCIRESGANQFRSQKNEVRLAGPKKFSHKGLCFGTLPASPIPSKRSNPWAPRSIAPRFPALAARLRLGSGRSTPSMRRPMSHGLCLVSLCAGSAVDEMSA